MKRRATRTKGPESASEAVRRAVLDSGLTLYRVAKDAGIPYAVLHRFMTGKRAVSLASFDKLCAYLGLQLTHAGRGQEGTND
jgi:predicted transcriptional regulator